jgi:integrase
LIAEAPEGERQWWSPAKAIVLTALGTGLRRGELIGLRWGAVNLLEAKIEVRETFVRGRFTTPKSRASRRVVELGPRARSPSSKNSGSARHTAATTTSSSAIRRRERRSRPASSPQARARTGWHREALPSFPRPPPHVTDARRGGRQPQIYVKARAGHS